MNVEMYEKYKPYRQELNKVFYMDKDYEVCIRKTKEFHNTLKSEGVLDKYNYQFMYMMYSKAYYRLKNVAQAIKYGKLAYKYSETVDEIYLSHWALRNAYSIINKNKAMYYNELMEDYFLNKNDLFGYADSLGEKGVLLNNDNYTLRAIEIFKKINDYKPYMISKEDKLDEQYINLFNIYSSNHDRDKNSKMHSTLHKIYNKNLKFKLSKQLFKSIAI